jgi:RNA recognition motif-containing protein
MLGRLLYSGVYFRNLQAGEVDAMTTIYVGNLNYRTTEEELARLFEPFGIVERISIPRDSATGNTRGFAFVEMQDENAAEEAIRALNGSKLGDRTLVVNKARPRAARAEGTGRGNGERRFGRS